MKIFDKEEKEQVYSLASEVSHYIYFLHWFFKISYINQGKLGDSLKNLRGKHKVEKIIFIFFLLFGKKKNYLKGTYSPASGVPMSMRVYLNILGKKSILPSTTYEACTI